MLALRFRLTMSSRAVIWSNAADKPRRGAPSASCASYAIRHYSRARKFVFTEPSVANDAAHGERVHGVVSGDRDDPNAVGHHDVLALPNDPKARLLQSAYSVLMVDARYSRHVLWGDLNFADDRALKKLIAGRNVFLNGILDVLEGFLFGGSLRPTSRQPRDRNAVPLIGLEERDLVPHCSPPTSV